MQVVCPTCNTAYRISKDRIPNKRTLATCKSCGGTIAIEPSTAGSETARTQPSSPPGQGFSIREQASQSAAREWSPSELTVLGEYSQLRDLDPGKFRLDEIFTPNKKGSYKTRVNKVKAKILKSMPDVLAKALQNGETVMRIAKAVAYHPAEIFLGNGWLTMLYNHYAVVATNQRLLFINVNPKISRPTHYFFQMPYRAIKKVATGLLGTSLVLHRLQGKRRIFTSVKRSMAREVREFVRGRQNGPQAPLAGGTVLENLCPSCFLPLEKNLLSCPECGAAFKRPRTALVKSLVLPGWGDFYLGHRGLGILELMGSAIVWAITIAALLGGGRENLIFAGIILTFYNGVDGLLTLHMAKKGYMLAAT
jgi:predicted Zn finger-like uncharacterized protein